MERIHIYHTNDIHSHLENWPRIEQFLKQQRKQHQDQDEVFLFDIGDFIDRWHPLTEATMGKASIELLNECQYTAVTIGNNEGINLPHDGLEQLYAASKFDVLAANLFQKNNQHPDWVKPYQIYRTKSGIRLGVIGLTANFTHLYELLGWNLTEPLNELKKWITAVKEQSDMVILLSHLGLRDDERIAAEFPEIDVILGAHTHHFLENGKLVDNTLLAAAGKFGYYVGHVTIVLDSKNSIQDKQAILYDTKELPVALNEAQIAEAFLDKGKKLLNGRVTTLTKPFLSDPFKETEFSLFLCKALREWCHTECAMLNAGILLGPLSGDVTEFDLLNICPHPINPCVVEVTGQELTEILRESMDESLHQKQITGLGFRGNELGIFVYDGIRFDSGEIFINGEKLEPQKIYTLALPDMFTFGHFFKGVLPHKNKKYFLPEFLRDILKWKLKTQS
ncbi:bifunctional UDP-sugar hydrolase/5'-nucleotidase [Neobacillus sp. 114]|uniref:bifunctional metallophosphatase/5'-nucleotidase n=1 Tax=Neobacillus sp. 114 TaxID=3048535 RepID=UPI001C223134|nr:bifunctional UDP-sugar hydrolase/5'-nucleotidase [Neobacillus sp. 114]MBU8914540.1 bifunctional metallophosphatase/5'-nucleotidase [Bacillus sp. FJAT-29953]